jgi:hypothetical protein
VITPNIPGNVLKDVVMDAIKRNDLETTRELVTQNQDHDWNAHDLFKVAAKYASEPMLNWVVEEAAMKMADWADQADWETIHGPFALGDTLRHENLQACQFCIDKLSETDQSYLILHLQRRIREGSAQLIDFLLQTCGRNLLKEITFQSPSAHSYPSDLRLLSANGVSLQEYRYLNVFEKHVLPANFCQWLLCSGVERGSIPIAAYFIDRGADVNTACIPVHHATFKGRAFKYSTPLFLAVRRGFADMAIFILENGADDEEDIRFLDGIQRIERMCGMN